MILKCPSCPAQHEFPFFHCPCCGAPVVKARVAATTSSLDIYSVVGPWSIRLVLLIEGTPVEEVTSAEISRGELRAEVAFGGRNELRRIGAPEVYRCVVDGNQAIQLPSQ